MPMYYRWINARDRESGVFMHSVFELFSNLALGLEKTGLSPTDDQTIYICKNIELSNDKKMCKTNQCYITTFTVSAEKQHFLVPEGHPSPICYKSHYRQIKNVIDLLKSESK